MAIFTLAVPAADIAAGGSDDESDDGYRAAIPNGNRAKAERRRPSPAIWRQLLLADRTGRLGETVAAGLALVGDAGPAGADPSALSAVVGSLKQAGFDQQARRIAFEAMIGRDF